jgi:uncharacterized membrane protein
MASFWRQLLQLVLALLVAVLGLGLYELAVVIHHA